MGLRTLLFIDMNDQGLTIKNQCLYAEALALEQAGYLQEAEAKYQQLLELDENCAEGWDGLSRIYFDLAQYDAALDALDCCLRLDGTQGYHYYRLGLIWEKLGNITEAIIAYQTGIELDADASDGCLKLGDIWAELGELESAELFYQKAIERQPYEVTGYLKLGNLFLGKNQDLDAIAIYQTGLNLYPHDSDLLYQMGLVLTVHQNTESAHLYFGLAAESQHRYETAIQFYQTVLQNSGGKVEIYLKLGTCYQRLEQWQKAVNIYEQGLQQFPDEMELYLALISAWQNLGETQNALQIAQQAIVRFPHQISVKLAKQSLLPILYNQFEEVEAYRQLFTQELTSLIAETDLEKLEVRQQALTAIGRGTHFYLQYQGYDDLELQQQYGKWVYRVMKANYPEWVNPLSLPPLKPNQKIKIGYISPHLTWHTVGLVFLGWLRNCDRSQFEIYCYFTGEEADQITDLFDLYSDQFYHINRNLETIVEQILADELDIIVFLDIGMCPQLTQIAGLRLAPIQCAAWGHPVTTGLPTIDYFISAEFLEPKDGEHHYSEKLIRLPNLGINYPKSILPKTLKNRLDFGLKQDVILYLSCQSLFKYLPDFDRLLVEISKQVKSAQFVFLAHWNPAITEKFRQRLKRIFAKASLDIDEYCIILPRLDKEDYLQLNTLADIGLDSIQFTGFLTTLDSLSCGLPLVTCEGKWMRSRQSAGILQRLGITETIAQNREEYIKIAIELGLNPDWRLAIQEKIKQNIEKLYEDKSCVQALETFYQQTVHSLNCF
ncbi:tetratricopeptide repeat protein [Planktothrix sp. FACHB-1365]|uniref:tetratricopeptide repeat protein n=1 Tax=Planktothrix sp. FACHB-1365 TaxID=2692855 RepID=UPI001684D4FE|nr:tetratricopeptide repeat protein [Planktothrix sp. FACHB-1365]MBD2484632.1 tetratricopeptide repeat protein [Planktothrix sp. FACHB-1365]